MGEGLAFCVEGLIFDCLGICACARGFNVKGRQWPLMLVNGFGLTLLAMVVNGVLCTLWVGSGAAYFAS